MSERCAECNSDDLVCAPCSVYPLVEAARTLVARLRLHGAGGSRTDAMLELERLVNEWGPFEAVTSQTDGGGR